MIDRGWSLCLAVALTLATLICWELSVPAGLAEAPGAPSVASSLTPARGDRAEAQSGERTAAMASTVLERPLFRASRRPAPASGTAASSVEPPLPRLAGIVVTPFARRAIFAGGEGGKAVVVAEGGSLGSVRVCEIAADQVTVIGPDGPRILRPSFLAASEREALPDAWMAQRQPSNTIGANGATFGAIPAARLSLLRGQLATSVRTLKTAP